MPSKSKVLLMGKSGSGKTSMRSIIFANYIPRDTNRLGPTIEVEQAHVRFLGNLVLHLWDCGGQETFMENYLVSQKDQIFKNVQVLIYVFDIDTREKLKDLRYFQACLEALLSNSPNAQVFCLVHKIDLVEESRRAFAFEEKKVEILKFSMASGSEKLVGPIQIFKSSIWDETLYKAWSAIVHKLIPNVHVIEDKLKHFANAIEAVDVVLFEKSTFLVIAHAECANHKDSYRLEKVSNIIKQFKLSCSRMGSAVQFVHVKNNNFAAFIGEFTANTFIMVILPDANTSAAVTHLNLNSARKAFEKLEMSR